MTDYSALRRLAHEASETEMDWLDRDWLSGIMADDWADYVAAIEPQVVIDLIDERERLADDYDKAWRHNLNDKNNCSVLVAEVARLSAELEQAKLIGRISCNFDGYKAVLDERDQLKSENEALRHDAELYRFVSQLAWYVDRAAQVYDIGNQSSPWVDDRRAVDADEVEAAISAAMSKGEQS